MNVIKKIYSMKRYTFLLSQLVRRDFKVKYRGSILGVLWSVLNPLLNMIVLSIVFGQVFRQIDNYKVYLLSGLVIFNFFSEATGASIGSVVYNFGLITKVYFPKFILPLSKTLSSAINLLISTAVYLILGCAMGNRIWAGYLLLLYVLACVLVFTAGLSFVLSALQVFFRDTQYLYGVITTIWLYATPIMYPLSIVPKQFLPAFEANPLYLFIDFLRTITMNGKIPTAQSFLFCAAWAVGAYIFGAVVFVKNQNKFIYYT